MNRTFLVTLDLPADIIAAGELPIIAETIREELLSSGHPVIEVRPWSGEGTPPALPDAWQSSNSQDIPS